MKKVKILHNPRCRKSREALIWIKEEHIDFDVIDYLNEGIDVAFMKRLLKKLGRHPADILRKNEEEYKLHIKGKDLSDDELIQLMIEFPKLIERPIVIMDDFAVIARPLDDLIEWYNKLTC